MTQINKIADGVVHGKRNLQTYSAENAFAAWGPAKLPGKWVGQKGPNPLLMMGLDRS